MTSRSRTSTDDGHVLIGGTGRAGTTLLVQYFTELGFDTGFGSERAQRRINPISNAGLEHNLSAERLPYVAKSPGFGAKLATALDEDRIRVRACIVPMRDLYSAAESRRQVSAQAEAAGLHPTRQPGGLAFAGGRNPKRQEEKLAVQFYKLVHALVLHDVPTYFLRFPDFARGEQDLFTALEPLLVEHGVDAAESAEAMARVARPDLIHRFARET